MMDDAALGVLSNVLTLRKIFKYLSARQLNTCCRVCKLWNDEAQKEKSSRHQIHWSTFPFELNTESEEPDASSRTRESWWDSVNSFIQESPFVPAAAVMLFSDSLYSELEMATGAAGRKRTKKDREDLLKFFPSALPESCRVHISVTDGIIGTDVEMKTKEYDECQMVMSLVLFGDSWDLKVHPFTCSYHNCQQMLKFWSGDCTGIPDCFSQLKKSEVKMFNLFCPINGLDQEIGYSLLRMYDWPLIAGGSVCYRFVKEGEDIYQCSLSTCHLSGVAVSGESVQVASVVIRSSVDTEAGVEACIKELAEHDLPLERSLGLMYACVGRGPHIHNGKHDVESKIFRKYFPNTPLFGFFGNGEIGMTYPQPDPLHIPAKRKVSKLSSDSASSVSSSSSANSMDSEDSQDSGRLSKAQLKRQINARKRKDREHKMKHPPKLMHAYTTVMCLISV